MKVSPPFVLEPDWSRVTADDLYRYLDRCKLEIGDRVLFVLNRRNHRHVAKLLKKLRQSGRSLPCDVVLKRNPIS